MTPVSASFAYSGVPTYFLREETQKERVIVTPLGLYSLTGVMVAMSYETEWVTHGEGYGASGSPPGCERTPQCSRQAAHPAPIGGLCKGSRGPCHSWASQPPREVLPGFRPSVPGSSRGTTETESSAQRSSTWGSWTQQTAPTPHQL